MRISGITLPDEKRVDISLTYLYGIGRSNVQGILKKANIDSAKRVKNLSEEEQKRILDTISTIKFDDKELMVWDVFQIKD